MSGRGRNGEYAIIVKTSEEQSGAILDINNSSAEERALREDWKMVLRKGSDLPRKTCPNIKLGKNPKRGFESSEEEQKKRNRHSKAANAGLKLRTSQITMITEPYIIKGSSKSLKLSGYTIHSKPRIHPRACIRTSDKLNVWFVPEFSNKDVCTVCLNIYDSITYICVAYLDRLLSIEEETLLTLINHCECKQKPLLLTMDSNTHNHLWDRKYTDTRGETLENIIDENTLVVVNEGNEPTFVTQRGSSTIDITLVNHYAFKKIEVIGWHVDLRPSMSDHRKDRGYTQSPNESLKLLMETHFPDCSIDRVPEAPLQVTNFDIDFVDTNRVRESFNSFDPYKTSGPDGLKPIVLQQLGDNIVEYISKLYQVVLSTGYTPKNWREMKVIFLPNPGKDDYSSAKSFRPIALSNLFFKGLERIVQWNIEETIPVFHSQHAYTRGLST
ncbi:uncharacterized protein [Lepeophtheirus salmonis]|uniref:uncharacterized protein n=1 Tax=Lepeophtheirus salmonis TaxID=72036 RepID=UPI003AF385F2